jgi:hypothetical protein
MAALLEICFACCTWHAVPVPCDHDSTLPCMTCGKPRGYRWLGNDRKEVKPRVRCWTCWATAEGLIGVPA